MSKKEKCPECDAYTGHSIGCSLMDEQCAKEMLAQYYDASLKIETRHREYIAWMKRRVNDAEKEAEFWKGKFVVVKHENNKLRKKLRNKS